MADFDKAFALTLEHEGGYVDDPDDTGGETFKGVARNKWPDWKGWEVIDNLKDDTNFPKNLDDDSTVQSLIKSFYKKNFWDKARLDEFDNQDIANEIFDTGVNQGMGTAIKYLQESLNLLNRNQKDYPDIAVDGGCGPVTVHTVNSNKRQHNVLKCLNGLQFMKYYTLAKKHTVYEKYFNGWLARIW